MTTDQDQTATRVNGFTAVGLVTALLLLIPLVAMQFTDEVNWNIGDFVVMGALLFGVGSAFVLISRKVDSKQRVIVGAVLALLFLWLWAELAVGIFTNWGD